MRQSHLAWLCWWRCCVRPIPIRCRLCVESPKSRCASSRAITYFSSSSSMPSSIALIRPDDNPGSIVVRSRRFSIKSFDDIPILCVRYDEWKREADVRVCSAATYGLSGAAGVLPFLLLFSLVSRFLTNSTHLRNLALHSTNRSGPQEPLITASSTAVNCASAWSFACMASLYLLARVIAVEYRQPYRLRARHQTHEGG